MFLFCFFTCESFKNPKFLSIKSVVFVLDAVEYRSKRISKSVFWFQNFQNCYRSQQVQF